MLRVEKACSVSPVYHVSIALAHSVVTASSQESQHLASPSVRCRSLRVAPACCLWRTTVPDERLLPLRTTACQKSSSGTRCRGVRASNKRSDSATYCLCATLVHNALSMHRRTCSRYHRPNVAALRTTPAVPDHTECSAAPRGPARSSASEPPDAARGRSPPRLPRR